MKTIRTSVSAAISRLLADIVTMLLVTSTAYAVNMDVHPARMSSNGIALTSGIVTGYSYGGLFWTPEEYADLVGADQSRAASFIVSAGSGKERLDSGVNSVFGLNLSTEELEKLSDEISLVIADSEEESPKSEPSSVSLPCDCMPLTAVTDAETGEQIVTLGGYHFKMDAGTEMESLMRQLQAWDAAGKPYKDQLFSEDWVYQTVHVENGKQSVMVDVAGKVITFCVDKSINELSDWEVLSVQRLAVVKSAAAAVPEK